MKNNYVVKLTSILILSLLIVSISSFSATVFAEEDDTIYYVGGNTSANMMPYSTNTYHINYPQSARIVRTQSVFLENECPTYQNGNPSLTNSCANVTGAMLLGFYDRYYESLIPNISAFSQQMGIYLPYGLMRSHVQPIINDLYNRMGTNTIKPGTSESQFFNGLESYCREKSATIVKQSVKSGSGLNLSAIEQAFEEGKIVAVFSSKHNVLTVSNNTLSISCSDVPHIFVVYGYDKFTVYSENNNVIDEYYVLQASKGVSSAFDTVFLNSDYFTIDNAYIIEIGG